MSPGGWGVTLSDAPILDARVSAIAPALVRRWRDISPNIDQAGLDHHFISVHLGGAKRLSRRGEGGSQSCEVVSGAHSVVPAGSAFVWNTEGPVDFVHIYFEQSLVENLVARAFDRNPANVCLQEGLGYDDTLVRSLAEALIDELEEGGSQRAYLDDIMHLLLCRILRLHSNVRCENAQARHVLAPYKLKRAVDFIDTYLAASIGVADIAAAIGISQFHFSRAFRQTTGMAPYCYLLARRVEAAKSLLISGETPLAEVAAQCGFQSGSQFSRMFKRATGATPSSYRSQQ